MQQPTPEFAASRSQVLLDWSFLRVGHMRQLSRVTRIDGEAIEPAGQLVAAWAWDAGERGRPRLLRANAEFYEPVTPEVGVIRLETEVRFRGGTCFADVDVTDGTIEVASVAVVLTVLD